MVDQQLLTRTHVCKLLQIPLRTLEHWMKLNEIPYIRVGRRSVRFDKKRLEEWLRDRENMPAGKSDSAKGQEGER